MIKFTKEEISLCKQVAEKHRKEINTGNRVIDGLASGILLIYRKVQKGFYLECVDEKGCLVTRTKQTIDFPLWAISDCLEFLKSKSFYGSISNVGSYYETYYKKIIVGENDEDLSIKVYSGIVKTPLEACLKAVLAVLEEGK